MTQKMNAPAQAANLKRQAEMERIRAGQVQSRAAVEAQEIARRRARLQGTQRTAAAANGIMLGDGRETGAADILEQDAAMEAAWDTEKMIYNANLEAWGYSENANIMRRNARTLTRSGNLAFASGLIQGGITGAAGYYSARAANARRSAGLLA